MTDDSWKEYAYKRIDQTITCAIDNTPLGDCPVCAHIKQVLGLEEVEGCVNIIGDIQCPASESCSIYVEITEHYYDDDMASRLIELKDMIHKDDYSEYEYYDDCDEYWDDEDDDWED